MQMKGMLTNMTGFGSHLRTLAYGRTFKATFVTRYFVTVSRFCARVWYFLSDLACEERSPEFQLPKRSEETSWLLDLYLVKLLHWIRQIWLDRFQQTSKYCFCCGTEHKSPNWFWLIFFVCFCFLHLRIVDCFQDLIQTVSFQLENGDNRWRRKKPAYGPVEFAPWWAPPHRKLQESWAQWALSLCSLFL